MDLETWSLPFALIGHLVIWCTVFNQVHATNTPRWFRKSAEKLIYLFVIGGFVLFAVRLFWPESIEGPLVRGWLYLCLAAFLLVLLRWLWRKIFRRSPDKLVAEQVQLTDLGREMTGPRHHGWQTALMDLVPGNQMLKLSVERRTIFLEHWPDELDGMVVAHLSDLHFTGKIPKEFFELVVQRCNEHQPDFVFLTGDIVEAAECLDWLPETLGKLASSHRKYYVLGNHDLRIRDEDLIRSGMQQAGFTAATGTWVAESWNDGRFHLAGDELPWFAGAEDLPPAPQTSILLSHSPDRIQRARELGVDLVLAGHCHGGQIRFPVIGPVIAPSKYGVRYASGTFQFPETLMHVSRGISGDDPIRWNCPPELGVIEIRTRKTR